MTAFNAAIVGVAVRSDNLSSLANAEQVGEGKFLAPLQVLVVQARFEAGHDRPSGADVVADLLALVVAKHGNVRQKQGTVFADPFEVEAVFVYEVEGESAVKQRRIDPLCRLAHVVVSVSGCGSRIKKLRALSHDEADVSEGSAGLQVGIVFLRPLKIIRTEFLPASIFSESRLRADEVVVERHAAGQRFVQPHSCFSGVFGSIAPADCAGRVSGGDVGGEFSFHHGAAHAALQAASPDGWIVRGAALIVGLEPDCGFAEAIEVGAAADVATKVCEVKAVGLLFFGDGVVLAPQLENAIIESAPVGGGVGRRKLATDCAMAVRQTADGRPSVGVEAIDVVE